MVKYILPLALIISPMILLGQSTVEIDTLATLDAQVKLISETTLIEGDVKDRKVVAILIDGIRSSVPDTTITLSKKETKSTYFRKQNGEHIFYTKLPDGGRYESQRTGYPFTKSSQMEILKCVYSNIQYPEKAIKGGLEGRFQLEFYVNTSGCIQDILVRGNALDIFVQEAKRAAQQCNCQFPVLQKGESKFPTFMVLPMKFMLE